LKTIFKDDVTLVSVVDLEWTQKENFTGPVLNATLNWITFVDDVEQDSGSILLNVDRELPTSVDAGSVKITKKGRATITVSLTVDNDDSNSGYAKDEYSVYGRGASIVPLIVVLVLAMTTRMVSCVVVFFLASLGLLSVFFLSLSCQDETLITFVSLFPFL
jgi:hypothetical protein